MMKELGLDVTVLKSGKIAYFSRAKTEKNDKEPLEPTESNQIVEISGSNNKTSSKNDGKSEYNPNILSKKDEKSENDQNAFSKNEEKSDIEVIEENFCEIIEIDQDGAVCDKNVFFNDHTYAILKKENIPTENLEKCKVCHSTIPSKDMSKHIESCAFDNPQNFNDELHLSDTKAMKSK